MLAEQPGIVRPRPARSRTALSLALFPQGVARASVAASRDAAPTDRPPPRHRDRDAPRREHGVRASGPAGAGVRPLARSAPVVACRASNLSRERRRSVARRPRALPARRTVHRSAAPRQNTLALGTGRRRERSSPRRRSARTVRALAGRRIARGPPAPKQRGVRRRDGGGRPRLAAQEARRRRRKLRDDQRSGSPRAAGRSRAPDSILGLSTTIVALARTRLDGERPRRADAATTMVTATTSRRRRRRFRSCRSRLMPRLSSSPVATATLRIDARADRRQSITYRPCSSGCGADRGDRVVEACTYDCLDIWTSGT